MKKIRPIKSTRYDWLINYIPELIKKGQVVSKIRLQVFLKQVHQANHVWERKETKQTKSTKHQKSFYIIKEKKKLKLQQLETLFETEEEKKKERNQRGKKKRLIIN